MTRRRWIADEFSGNEAALTGEHANHLARVLRGQVGQEFDVAVGDVVRRGKIKAIAPARVEFELGEEIAGTAVAAITLLPAIFKFDRMEWAIEKCVELGVSRIVPIIARRTDAHLSAASAKRVDRWRRIALLAAEQSRRSQPPEVGTPIQLRAALDFTAELRIVLSEAESKVQLRDILASHEEGQAIALAVGPEGGWVEEELRLFQEAGWRSTSLGPMILRAETAAIAATAIAIAELG
jgi:16S rRNA (uracil1498-N3)-methyltransferase